MIFSATSRFAVSSRSALPFQIDCQNMPVFILVKRPVITLSSTDIPSNRAMFWNVRAMPCCATS